MSSAPEKPKKEKKEKKKSKKEKPIKEKPKKEKLKKDKSKKDIGNAMIVEASRLPDDIPTAKKQFSERYKSVIKQLKEEMNRIEKNSDTLCTMRAPIGTSFTYFREMFHILNPHVAMRIVELAKKKGNNGEFDEDGLKNVLYALSESAPVEDKVKLCFDCYARDGDSGRPRMIGINQVQELLRENETMLLAWNPKMRETLIQELLKELEGDSMDEANFTRFVLKKANSVLTIFTSDIEKKLQSMVLVNREKRRLKSLYHPFREWYVNGL